MVVIWVDLAVITEPGEFGRRSSSDEGVEPHRVTLAHLAVRRAHLELWLQLRLEHTTDVLWVVRAGSARVPGGGRGRYTQLMMESKHCFIYHCTRRNFKPIACNGIHYHINYQNK